MGKLYPMHEARKILGVSLKTLQRWDKAGKIKTVRTPGGRRRVPESEIKRLLGEKEDGPVNRVLAVYARVSSHEQKAKGCLDRQVEQIKKHFDHCPFDNVLVVTDVSSGLNDWRKGLLKTYFESYGVKIHIVNGEEDKKTVYEELVEDLLSIVTSFSGKLYGIRSRRKDEVTSKIREVIENAGYLPDENR